MLGSCSCSWGLRLGGSTRALAESEEIQKVHRAWVGVLWLRLLGPFAPRRRHVRAQDLRALMRGNINWGRTLGGRGYRWMLVAMRLGMRVALAVVRLLLLRVRREQTGLVIRLALGLRIILTRSV